MSHSGVNILLDGLTGGDHISILELHGFCTLCPELTTNNNLHVERWK